MQGEQLESKWHSHFGNYIVNTLLALHKFQAKKQVFPNRIENDRNGTKQLHRSVSTFCYAVGFAAVFLSDANRIHHKWFHRNSEMQWWCHTSKSTHTEGRVTPPRQTEGWSPTKGRTPPSVPEANRGKRAPSIVYLTRVPAGSLSSSDAVSLASSEKRSELRASESESEVLAGSTWCVFPQPDGKSCDLKHLVHFAYL